MDLFHNSDCCFLLPDDFCSLPKKNTQAATASAAKKPHNWNLHYTVEKESVCVDARCMLFQSKQNASASCERERERERVQNELWAASYFVIPVVQRFVCASIIFYEFRQYNIWVQTVLQC